MPYVLTKTPHQKIDQNGISSQWEGKHIRFIYHDKLSINDLKNKKNKRMSIISTIQILMIALFMHTTSLYNFSISSFFIHVINW